MSEEQTWIPFAGTLKQKFDDIVVLEADDGGKIYMRPDDIKEGDKEVFIKKGACAVDIIGKACWLKPSYHPQ